MTSLSAFVAHSAAHVGRGIAFGLGVTLIVSGVLQALRIFSLASRRGWQDVDENGLRLVRFAVVIGAGVFLVKVVT